MAPRSLLLCALLAGAPAAALAQAEEPVTLGPPELRNFELPGTRTTPPATPAPLPPAAERPTPAPSPTASPAREPEPRPRAEQPRPSPAPADRTERAERSEPAPERAPPQRTEIETAPAPEAAAPPAATTLPLPPLPQRSAPMPPSPSPEAAGEESGGWGGWIAALLALLAAAGALLLVRRRLAQSAQAKEVEAAAERHRRARAKIAAAAAPAVPAHPAAPAQPEARIELDFQPQRVVIREGVAEINFKLAIRNAGTMAAEDVRIAVQTFNAADKPGLEAFLAETEVEPGPMPLRMPAGYEEKLEGIGKLEGDEIRAIEVHGRRLLIPVVAFNVVWRLADGRSGQTALSWLVGRESDPPAEKMGAFRLDLGARLYRTVGQRPNRPPAPKPPKKVRVRIEA